MSITRPSVRQHVPRFVTLVLEKLEDEEDRISRTGAVSWQRTTRGSSMCNRTEKKNNYQSLKMKKTHQNSDVSRTISRDATIKNTRLSFTRTIRRKRDPFNPLVHPHRFGERQKKRGAARAGARKERKR